jgi:peroxiredoxin
MGDRKMKKALAASVIAVAAALAGVGAVQADRAEGPAAMSRVASRVDNFQLTDHTRFAHDLYYYGYAPAVVIMTQANGSPVSHAAAAELERLAAAHKGRGVVFYMLNSADSRDAVAAEAKRLNLTIPVLIDEQQLVGEQLGVQREGEVFVINPKTWAVAYHGPLAEAGAAIEAVAAGQAVRTARVPVTTGRAISFPARARAPEFAKISYAREIAPIIQAKCTNCHLNGGIGPFAMDSYEVVKGFAPMIRETVRTKRMPPYFPDPHIGEFRNDQGLTADERKKLVHWIEAGAPRGEGVDPLLVNKTRVASPWPESLGKPDVIVELPAFKVPATGLVPYQNMRVKNPFEQDAWLKAIAMKPGDRRVLHHVVSNHRPDPNAPRSAIPGGSVGSYTPGAEPQVMGPGAGAPVPAGGELNFQMHYTTFGKETTDKTQVGFYVLKEKPKYIKRSFVISDFALHIPAGEARHRETAYATVPADMYIYTLYPHAHYRGRHVELKLITPDGKEKMLLSLPKYDFNWQRDYDPVEPILIKKGSRLVATWVYDNSKYNSANPDPKINVTWGEQSHEEMMYFRINYRWADETTDKVRQDLQTALQSSQMLGALDDNMDGKVQLAELRGPMATVLKTRFAEMDKNRSGALEADELNAAGGRREFRRAACETPDL